LKKADPVMRATCSCSRADKLGEIFWGIMVPAPRERGRGWFCPRCMLEVEGAIQLGETGGCWGRGWTGEVGPWPYARGVVGRPFGIPGCQGMLRRRSSRLEFLEWEEYVGTL